jgi:hypothetical protein
MSDESHFFIDGHVCSHNFIIWATSENKPQFHFADTNMLNSPSVHVWQMPRLFHSSLKVMFEGVYLQMLHARRIYARTEALMGEELGHVIFMQDGATPHRRHDVHGWMTMEKFPQDCFIAIAYGLDLGCSPDQ